MTHPADVEGFAGLEAIDRRFHVLVYIDEDAGLDFEIVPALAVAGPLEAFFEPWFVFIHRPRHKTERQPAVCDLAGQSHGRFVAGAEIDRDIRVHVQDRLQRLADAKTAFARIGQLKLLAVVRQTFFSLPYLAHDGGIIFQPVVGLAPGLTVPPLDDLRS